MAILLNLETPELQGELEIRDYFALENPDAANRVIQELFKQFPRTCRLSASKSQTYGPDLETVTFPAREPV